MESRRRIDDGQVTAVHELVHAKGLDAELDRASAVRGCVEEDIPVQAGAHVDAVRGQPLELERPPPARIANTTFTEAKRGCAYESHVR